VARSTLYHRPCLIRDDGQSVMRALDEQYLVAPFYGTRRMAVALCAVGLVVNRKRERRLMRLEAIYQKPDTSRRRSEHKVYAYLLRDLSIDRRNQLWCADIT
jgi:putative transposase